MKNSAIKSVICIALSAVVITGVFTGCGAKKSDESVSSTDASLTSVSKTTETSTTQQAEKKTLKATKEETDQFTEVIKNIIESRTMWGLDVGYNNKNNDLEYALMSTYVNFYSVWDYCEKKYNWQGDVVHYSGPDNYSENPWTPDPLGYYEYMYARLDGNKVDWILKNIFGVTPDHSFNSKKNEDSWFSCYYNNGYYYFADGDLPADAGMYIKDVKTTEENGQYVFTLSGYGEYSGGEFDESKHVKDFTVVTELNEVDGSREWKLISIS